MEDNNKDFDSIANRAKRRPTGKTSLPDLVAGGYAKLPPQAVELEEVVLGALMLEKDPLTAVVEFLKPQCFYKEAHQKIYQAIANLFQRSDPVDLLTVTEELRKMGDLDLVGGPYYISQLTNRVASSANVEYHARIILQKFIQRELIRVSSETITNSYQDTADAFLLLDKAEKDLFEIAESGIRRNFDSMPNLLNKALDQIKEASKQTSGVTGVTSGFTALDRVTSGWQPSDLIILAARPGMGKTAFVLALARNAAVDAGKGVALFSLEMSSVQLVNRLISAETEIPNEKLKKGTLEPYEWQQLSSRTSKLFETPLYIDDTPALSVFELRAKCRRLKAQKDISMIIIDYLQLMTAGDGIKNGNREQEISTISRSLKSIAKELNIPVIALSQLSRAVETRSGTSTSKKPQLSDLRESGAIEQDADMVMFIYRPEYYKIEEDEEGNSLKGLAQIIIAKHRNGALEDVNLRFVSHLAKFTDYDDMAYAGSPFGGSFNTSDPGPSSNNDNPNKIRYSSKINEDSNEDMAPF